MAEAPAAASSERSESRRSERGWGPASSKKRIDDLAKRVQTVETKMDQVPATIDQRFDAVDAAIAEQRQYTEFAFDKLERSMIVRFDGVDAQFAGIKGEFAGLKAEVRTIGSGLGRLERKLDQFIDRHLPPNPPNTQEQPK